MFSFAVLIGSILKPSALVLASSVIAIFLVLILNEKRLSKISSLNEELAYKLESLFPIPKYFHTDVNVINLLAIYICIG